MGLALTFLTLANLALLLMMIAGAGFILEGVNNTGPMMPEAIFYVALMVACLVAPAFAWWGRRTWSVQATLATAALPLLFAGLALVARPI